MCPSLPFGLRRGSLRGASLAKAGGAERDRTADLVIANDALSQLSYSPKQARVYPSASGPVNARARQKAAHEGCNVPCGIACGESGGQLNRKRICSGAFMRAILDLILLVLQLYSWIIIAIAVLSWLVAFGVINIRNDFVRAIWNAPSESGVVWNINLPSVPAGASEPEIVFCQHNTSPLPVSFQRDETGAFVYSGHYHTRCRPAEGDVSACFGGAIAISKIPL